MNSPRMFDFYPINNFICKYTEIAPQAEARDDVNSVERDKVVLFRPEHSYNAHCSSVKFEIVHECT